MIDILSFHSLFSSPPKPQPLKISKIFAENCVIGGTFDKFHYGHQAFISSAFNVAKKVHVCIMSDDGVRFWIKKEHSDKIDAFHERLEKIKEFLDEYNLSHRVTLCEIDDPFSYATKGKQALLLDSILVSTENVVLKRTLMLNDIRYSKKMSRLHIFRMPLIVDKDGFPFSATRIRAGEHIYVPKISSYKLTKEIVSEIREPKGNLVDSAEDLPKPKSPVIAIGDIVVSNLSKKNYPISIAIIDKRSRREELEDYFIYFSSEENTTEIPPYLPTRNPPGVISRDTWTKIIIALFQKNPTVIRVHGEEDLLGFPATILAPKGTMIVYGQPPPWNKLVYYYVDEDIRAHAYYLLKRMKQINDKVSTG